MDPTSPTVFEVMKQRLRWLGQRQQVLAQNVANADTPQFRPSDLQPFTFRMALGQASPPLRPVMSNAAHQRGTINPRGDIARASADRNFYETSPDGNQVNLEQQLFKVADTQSNYQLVTNLYRKQVGMVRIVLGRGQQ